MVIVNSFNSLTSFAYLVSISPHAQDKRRVKIIFTLYFKPLFDAFPYNLASHQDFSLFVSRSFGSLC